MPKTTQAIINHIQLSLKHCAEREREREEKLCMRLSCDAVITCSHSRQHVTCHKQSGGVSACSRPASQDSSMVSSGGSGFAWQMATVSLAQRLHINWLIDFSSINSIVSACCCRCFCCCCLLSHSLSVPTSTRQIYAVPAALSCSQLPSTNFLLPRQIVKLPCVPWPTTASLLSATSLALPPPVSNPWQAEAQSSLHKARIWQAICVYCVAIKICPQETECHWPSLDGS